MRRPRALGWVLLLALALRLAHFFAVRQDPFIVYPILDSQEFDRWARAILAGTASREAFFQPPLYPYFVAVLYAVVAAPATVYLTQIAFSLLGCWALYRAGKRLADEATGLAAAALFATYPVFVLHDVQLLKESLAVTLVALLLWTLVEARARGGAAAWFCAGGLSGLLALLRENVLLLAPLLAALAWRRNAPPRRNLRHAVCFLVAAMVPLVPVAWRNARGGGGFLPTTFQGGVNFYIGNHAGADGTYQPLVPGKQVPALERAESIRLAEQATGRRLSPSEVSSFWLRRALEWARQRPVDFLRLQGHKLRLFWSWYEYPDAVDAYYLRSISPALRLPWLEFGGVTLLALAGLWAIRRRLADFAPVLIWIAGSTLATTTFFIFSRYRLITVPALLLLAALPLAALVRAVAAGDRRSVAAGGALLLAAVLLPRLPGYGPRWDLVHFNRGRVFQETGDNAAAKIEYERALEANPRDFLSCLNLGTIAARERSYQDAMMWFSRAAVLEPNSDDAEANLGGVLLASGDFVGARVHLEKALVLNPSNAFANRNLAILQKREMQPPGPQ